MTLEEAKRIVFDAKPEFAKLYKEWGEKTWDKYAESKYQVNKPLLRNERSNEFLDTFKKILVPLIGEEKTDRTIQDLIENPLVSTADHHGVLCHPFFSNSAFVRSSSLAPTICFTCGCVSLSNSSYPRGIFFHDENLNEVRIPFASLRGRRRSLYGLPAIGMKSIEKELDKVNHLKLRTSATEKLKEFLRKVKNSNIIFSQDHFSDQLTIINDMLWENLFEEKRGNLVYIEIETIIRSLLLKHHLDHETDIHKIIFDHETRESYIKNFEKVTGAHKTEEEKGSHLFWFIDEIENTRKQLFLKNNCLETLDGKISIPLVPHIIREYLLRYELLPSMAFCYSIISFYYGITLGGGFSQIQYLGDMKKAWEKTFGVKIDIETNTFTGEFVLLTLEKNKKIIGASLIDALLYKDDQSEEINNHIRKIKISDTLDHMMIEFIEIVTGKRELIPDLPKVSPYICLK